MDIATFRSGFPEFADVLVYPDAQINFWSAIAEAQLDQTRWTTTWVFAVQLYVAHEITLARQNLKASTIGGTPGQHGGIVNSKTVGSVSASYDSATQSEKNAGWWNRTTYGMQLWRLMRIYGAGVVQL